MNSDDQQHKGQQSDQKSDQKSAQGQSDQNPSQLKIKKLQWQCRRGMLELDVILIPFLDKHFSSLDLQSQAQFEELLTQPDPDLYTWIMGYGECEVEALQPIIATIREKMNIHS
ncbi:MAG: succinate dehydrogenase assembly factor 2 [Kangiellaceae bacterium]|nr:succinate dehydrogenase assembly factor 2 [Kangiellaceae bacterium]MCW8997730.1 succinate dehydrogenase assembly factor 2 [Kangiellaceae bacterium]MCW9017981.1 succinate dehydrogenase assembly factor 2 [Kangiellaceae bacterium]